MQVQEFAYQAMYEVGTSEKCPHCLTAVRFEFVQIVAPGRWNDQSSEAINLITPSNRDEMRLNISGCPACGRLILVRRQTTASNGTPEEILIHPLGSPRTVAAQVPPHIAADYKEACLVLPYSSKAAAALSRRCLQTVLREAAKVKPQDLSKEIDEVIPKLPSHIAEQIDAVRNVGNFAAHPNKDQMTGVVMDVEPEEATWNLDVLDLLFDFYYVQPDMAKRKRDALNAKLSAAGKPEMKS